MRGSMPMRRVAYLAALAALAVSLAGCESLRKAAGLTKVSPDEFAVVTKAPLIIPPELQSEAAEARRRPDQPGRPDRRGTGCAVRRQSAGHQQSRPAQRGRTGTPVQGRRQQCQRHDPPEDRRRQSRHAGGRSELHQPAPVRHGQRRQRRKAGGRRSREASVWMRRSRAAMARRSRPRRKTRRRSRRTAAAGSMGFSRSGLCAALIAAALCGAIGMGSGAPRRSRRRSHPVAGRRGPRSSSSPCRTACGRRRAGSPRARRHADAVVSRRRRR